MQEEGHRRGPALLPAPWSPRTTPPGFPKSRVLGPYTGTSACCPAQAGNTKPAFLAGGADTAVPTEALSSAIPEREEPSTSRGSRRVLR